MRTAVIFEKYILYEDGRLYSNKTNKFLKESTSVVYKAYCVYFEGMKKGVNTHRFLAKCFIPNPNNYKQVNHIDGNKHNNGLDNLEWVTISQNILHSFRLGLQKPIFTKKVICTETGVIYNSAKEVFNKLGYKNYNTFCNMLNENRIHQPNRTTFKYL